MSSARPETSATTATVTLTDAQYSVLRQLADGLVVKYVHPITRRWLQQRGYITWTRSRGPFRSYSITTLGLQVVASAIREPQYTGPSASMSAPEPALAAHGTRRQAPESNVTVVAATSALDDEVTIPIAKIEGGVLGAHRQR